jgi:hypothetical protein
LIACISKKDIAATKVMALTDPKEAAAAPASLTLSLVRRIKKAYNGTMEASKSPKSSE